jgi:predicted aspartyl protease
MGGYRQWIGRATAGAFALAAVPALAAPACQLVKIGELSVTTAHNRPLAAISINGHAAQMLVDTGADRSLLWRPALESLGLRAVASNVKSYGVNGTDQAGIVTVRDFGLGDSVVHDLTLFVVGRGTGAPFAGLLGEDFLAKFDVEFDLSSHVIRLFTPKNCSGDEVVYWANAYSVTPIVHLMGSELERRSAGEEHRPLVKVLLNGHEAVALLDSGASVSGVTADLVRRPGMAPEAAPTTAGTIRGIASQPLDTSLAVFPTLTVGQEQIQNVKLRIAELFNRNREAMTGSFIPVDPVTEPDMIIGADFFLAHRIYIAHSQGKVYFTYRGGPIFQTEPQAPATPPAAGAGAAEASSGEPGKKQE